MQNDDDWIEKFNKKTINFLWVVFLSMLTALITTILLTR